MPSRAFYEAYIASCNARRFDQLGEFVAEDVRVDDQECGLARYVARLRAVTEAFPDYRWELEHFVIEGDWMAAHLLDRGTQAAPFRGVASSGRRFSAQEFAFYRVRDGRIAEVWARADEAAMIDQLRPE